MKRALSPTIRTMARRRFLKTVMVLSLFPSWTVLGRSLEYGSDATVKPRDSRKASDVADLSAWPDQHHRLNDSYLGPVPLRQAHEIFDRLSRLQRTVGYANFCLLNFDDMLHIAGSYATIGEFTASEIACLELLFYTDAADYGFKGTKTFSQITDRIDKQRSIKIVGSGNYLYKGPAMELYKRISRDVGRQLVLTAGVRGIVKQFYLFLAKALRHNGNLSLTSRSIAPPGYSFHVAGDFDVGKAGFGVANFTPRFTETNVYRKLQSLDYVRFRYPLGNPSGVVFEPWHIQVV